MAVTTTVGSGTSSFSFRPFPLIHVLPRVRSVSSSVSPQSSETADALKKEPLAGTHRLEYPQMGHFLSGVLVWFPSGVRMD
jgi:hypothetical protein